jgi:hypothetical protein
MHFIFFVEATEQFWTARRWSHFLHIDGSTGNKLCNLLFMKRLFSGTLEKIQLGSRHQPVNKTPARSLMTERSCSNVSKPDENY